MFFGKRRMAVLKFFAALLKLVRATVFLLLAHTPLVEQSVREVKTIFVANGRYNCYYGLNAGLLFQCIKHAVYFIACRGGEDTGGVADVARLVLQVDFRDVFGGIYFLCV